jgi:hypothetical protein
MHVIVADDASLISAPLRRQTHVQCTVEDGPQNPATESSS